MKTFFGAVDFVVAKVSDWALTVSGILIVVMGFLTTYGVSRRYFFDSPEPYSYELSTIFLTSCILLAIPHLQWLRKNIRVDFVIAHMSRKWQFIFDNIIQPILGLVYASVIVWKSAGVFWKSFERGETSQSVWQEPLWPMKLLVTIAIAWLLFVLLSQLVHGIINLANGRYTEHGAIAEDLQGFAEEPTEDDTATEA